MNKLNFNSMSNGNIMPLLMSFTPGTRIREEKNPCQHIYNDGKQIVAYDMANARIVGTKSLKTSATKVGRVTSTDKKNEIDDRKQVR
jgi:hypothetical protein